MIKLLFLFLLGLQFSVQANNIDKNLLNKIEAHLNSIRTLESSFTQMSGTQTLTGKFYLSRPGALKFSYDPPSPLLIVANRESLIYEDCTTHQVSYFPLDSGPAALLLQDSIKLLKILNVLKIEEIQGTINLTTEDKSGIQTIFEFDTKTLNLKGWITIDTQNRKVRILLRDAKYNIPLQDSLFTYQRPARQVKQRHKA